jgi:hypothetical protein
MEKGTRTVALLLLLLGFLAFVPGKAEADWLKIWAEGRGDVYYGTSDLFKTFSPPIGGGLEIGVEILDITLFGELLAMAPDWMIYTANLGWDIDFGGDDSLRFTVGLYTGPIFFQLPKSNAPTGVDLSGLTPDEQTTLEQAACLQKGISPCTLGIQDIQNDFNAYSSQESQLNDIAFGWNIVRLRLALDYPLVKFFYLGLAVQGGYHYIVSGQSVVAGMKNKVINEYANQYGLDATMTGRLRQAVGAKAVDTGSLDGFNYGVHIYARFEFGL